MTFNVLVETTDLENFLMDQFFSFATIPVIKNKYPESRIVFGCDLTFYEFFKKFKIIDHVFINSLFGHEASYINCQYKIRGKFSDFSAINRSHLFKESMDLFKSNINLFELKIDQPERVKYLLEKLNIKDSKNLFSIGYRYKNNKYNSYILMPSVITDFPVKKDGLVFINPFDIFLLSRYCNYWICDEFWFTFFAKFSLDANAIIIGKENIYKNTLYEYFVGKPYPDKTGLYKYIEKFDTKEIDKIIN